MNTIKKPKNMKELNGDLVAAYTDLRNHVLRVPEAKEISNMAGKIISNVCAQMEVHKMCKTKELAADDLLCF